MNDLAQLVFIRSPRERARGAAARRVRREILFDRASRARYSTDASIYQLEPIGIVVPTHRRSARGARDRRRGGSTAFAARRRQLAVRTGRRRSTGHRSHQVSQSRAGSRRRARGGAARRRARCAERLAAAERPVVPRRCVDQRPGHDRRHGRQQLLRLALDRLRQHGAQRARHRSPHRRRRDVALRPDEREAVGHAGTRSSLRGYGCYTSAKGRRSRRASRRCCASRRLQPRPHRPAARQRRAHPGRLRRHAGLVRARCT